MPLDGEVESNMQRSASRAAKPRNPDTFDLWLQQGLLNTYYEIAKEPIPEELLQLIEGIGGGSDDRMGCPLRNQ